MTSETKYKISFDMGGGGIKEDLLLHSRDDFSRKIKISKDTSLVLFTPDSGRVKRDEFFIPNVNNGLFRIMAYLLEHGESCEIVYTDIDNMDEAWKKIRANDPPILGFSTYYNTMKSDLENIVKASSLSPQSLIVTGGFEASLNKQWLELEDLVDIVTLGEGEILLLTLVRKIKEYRAQNKQTKNKKQLFKKWLIEEFKKDKIPAVYILLDGKVAYYEPFKRIEEKLYRKINLNAFIKHISKNQFERYWKLSNKLYRGKKDSYFRIISSDHCPWKCRFCQTSIFYSSLTGQKNTAVRHLSPEDIVRIISSTGLAYPYITHIYIDDENFLLDPARANATADLIIDAKKSNRIRRNLRFLCRARSNNINRQICEKLKASGWETISIGTESYSQAELDFMNKGVTVKQNINAIKTVIETGLSTAENLILFTPVSTKESFFESARQVCENISKYSIDSAATMFITPLAGTEFWADGDFRMVSDKDYDDLPFEDKVFFINKKTRYAYLGGIIKVPGKNLTFPHPEIMLCQDKFMRHVSLMSLANLPLNIKYLRKFLKNHDVFFSRKFITLANLFSAADGIYKLTSEKSWKSLRNFIIEVVKSL